MFAMQIVNLAKKSNDNTDKCSVRNSVIDDDFYYWYFCFKWWYMRGQDSFNVIVTVTQNDVDKFVDFCVLSEKIRACTSWKKWEETTEYKKVLSEHD